MRISDWSSDVCSSDLLGHFVQQATGLRGPCITVATACSSSAKVFAQAARLIGAGAADAALVGGVDTLCGSVLFGFNSLGLRSEEHTSELQSLMRISYAVFCLKKKKTVQPLKTENHDHEQ